MRLNNGIKLIIEYYTIFATVKGDKSWMTLKIGLFFQYKSLLILAFFLPTFYLLFEYGKGK